MNTNRVVPSSKIVADEGVKQGTNLFGKGFSLSLKGDTKIENIISDVEEKIRDNKWKLPNNEADISRSILEAMHQKKNYGGYHEDLSAAQKELEKVGHDLEQAELKGDKKLVKSLKKEIEELSDKREEAVGKSRHKDSKDYNSGGLSCAEMGTIASYIHDRVGIPNNLVFGYSRETNSKNGGGHVYLQSKLTGNVIDATYKEGYLTNLNGARASEGEIIIADNSRDTYAYGGGEINMFTALKYRFSGQSGNELMNNRLSRNVDNAITDFEADGGMVSTARAGHHSNAHPSGVEAKYLSQHAERAMQIHDADKDGYLDKKEMKAAKINPNAFPDHDKVAIKDIAKAFREDIKLSDADGNKHITAKEFANFKTVKADKHHER